MTWEQANGKISQAAEDIVADTALRFEREISSRSVWPVDTGASRRAWSKRKIKDGFHEVFNDVSGNGKDKVNYSAILWLGRRFVGNRWQGSLFMPLGGEPTFKKHRDIMIRKLQGVTK